MQQFSVIIKGQSILHKLEVKGRNMQKERIWGCDVIRAVSAIGIIGHHICRELQARKITMDFYVLGDYANGNFGWLFVTLFFILSGAMLYLNYAYLPSTAVKQYYYKRWKSIFPIFYIIWFYFYIQNVLNTGEIFYNGNAARMLWSLLGIDGYVNIKVPTYYICGEWFLGVIIVLYLLYPLVLKFYNTNKRLYFIVLIGMFLIEDYFKLSFQTGPFRSIISCLLSFSSGMWLIEHRNNIQKTGFVMIMSAFSLLLLCREFDLWGKYENILVHILGIALFISLLYWGNILMKNRVIQSVISLISRISLPVFLLQHIIIIRVVKNIVENLSWEGYLILFAVTTMLIIMAAWAIQQINYSIIKSRLFVWLDKKFIIQ